MQFGTKLKISSYLNTGLYGWFIKLIVDVFK